MRVLSIGVSRVRQTAYEGQFGSPKTRSSKRDVAISQPIHDRLLRIAGNSDNVRAEIRNAPSSLLCQAGWRHGRPPRLFEMGLFEAFAKNIIELAQSNQKHWAETAIFVTVDEGGGFMASQVEPLVAA